MQTLRMLLYQVPVLTLVHTEYHVVTNSTWVSPSLHWYSLRAGSKHILLCCLRALSSLNYRRSMITPSYRNKFLQNFSVMGLLDRVRPTPYYRYLLSLLCRT